MTKQDITLNDRFDLSKHHVLLNGTQALVRLMLMQKERDRVAGLNTAGYVSGYRGSPLRGVELLMERAEKPPSAAQVTFSPGLNEELGAPRACGTQHVVISGRPDRCVVSVITKQEVVSVAAGDPVFA